MLKGQVTATQPQSLQPHPLPWMACLRHNNQRVIRLDNLMVRILGDTDLLINVDVYNLADDLEFNYTVEYAVYNMSGDYWGGHGTTQVQAQTLETAQLHQNPLQLVSMNNTYTGYGHDDLDMYDQYQIFVPLATPSGFS